MHELGVVREAIRTVDAFADENGIQEIDTIVLLIGDLSLVIPEYVENLYPAVVEGTKYEKTKLKIEVEEGRAVCRRCKRAFEVVKNEGYCPRCGVRDSDVISGRDFLIKEIIVP